MTKYEEPVALRPIGRLSQMHADLQHNVCLEALGAACCTEGHDAAKGVSDGQ